MIQNGLSINVKTLLTPKLKLSLKINSVYKTFKAGFF